MYIDFTTPKDTQQIVIHTKKDHNLSLDRAFLLLGTLFILAASLYLLRCITRGPSSAPKKRFLDKKPLAKPKRSQGNLYKKVFLCGLFSTLLSKDEDIVEIDVSESCNADAGDDRPLQDGV